VIFHKIPRGVVVVVAVAAVVAAAVVVFVYTPSFQQIPLLSYFGVLE